MAEVELNQKNNFDNFKEKYGNLDENIENGDLAFEIQSMISGKNKFEGLVSQIESIESKITAGHNPEDFMLLDVESRVKDGIYFAKELKTNNIEKARLYFAKFLGDKNFDDALLKLKTKKLNEVEKSLVELVCENSKEMLSQVKTTISKKISETDIKLEEVQEQYLAQLDTIGKISHYKTTTETQMAQIKSKMDEFQKDLQKSQSNSQYSQYLGKITQEMFKTKARASKLAADYELCIMSLPSMENALARYENSIANIEKYKRSFQEKELELSIAMQNVNLSIKEVQFGTIKSFVGISEDYSKAIKQSSQINDYLLKRNNVMNKAYDSLSGNGAKFNTNFEETSTVKLNPFEIFEKARIKGDEYMGRIRQKSK